MKEGRIVNNLYPKCFICNMTPPGGLHDGFWLSGKFVCSFCEQAIVIIGPENKEYQHNIENIKRLLYG